MAKQTASKSHQTTDRVAGKAHEAVDAAAERAGRAEETVREKVSEADERIRETGRHARERSQDLLGQVSDYVQDNPLTALGIAFAAGTIFSSITRKR